MTAIQITARELRDTDTIVLNPAATPAHVIRKENLEITRQRYGLYYRFDEYSDGEMVGRLLGTLHYTDKVWVER